MFHLIKSIYALTIVICQHIIIPIGFIEIMEDENI